MRRWECVVNKLMSIISGMDREKVYKRFGIGLRVGCTIFGCRSETIACLWCVHSM
jgi:hypothetical protein